MLEDRQLVLKMKNGDKDALRKIYLKYKDRLFTIAMSLLNETNAAEDALHDVFVGFAANIQNFRFYGSLKNYLIKCIVNRAHDMYRSKMYQVVEVKRIEPNHSDSDNPSMQVITAEQANLLDEALTKIPLPQREVVVMHLQGGLKFREIASFQNVSINTVQGRYRYGLEKLRSILTSELTQ